MSCLVAEACPAPRLLQLGRIQIGLQSTGGLCCQEAVAGAMSCPPAEAAWLVDRWLAERLSLP